VPKRQTSWKAFLKAHWDVLGATDFTTIEVWTKGGLATIYLLFVMEVGRAESISPALQPTPPSHG
jgi:hypothetical protein